MLAQNIGILQLSQAWTILIYLLTAFEKLEKVVTPSFWQLVTPLQQIVYHKYTNIVYSKDRIEQWGSYKQCINTTLL